MKVPLLDLHAQYRPVMDRIRTEIEKVFQSHYYILGPQVREFEAKMEKYLDAKHAIGCASGTDALILAMMAIDLKPGDEVITTPFTFFATASCIHRSGGKIVFADIDPDTFNIDPRAIEAAITPKTKAIMPVHLFGQSADMDAIMAIAARHGIAVIEDNAQGIGATWKGKFAGTIGDIGTLSFFPSKNLGAMGDAGMCLTNDDHLAARLRQLRVHGENPKYYHHYVGLNSRLDTIQAAVLGVKLDYLAEWSEGRRKNAAFYREHLSELSGLRLPIETPGSQMIYNQYTLLTDARDQLMEHLKQHEIGHAVYYPLPLHLQECFAYLGYKAGDFPVSENAAKKVVSIPIYAELTDEQKQFVVDTIKAFYR